MQDYSSSRPLFSIILPTFNRAKFLSIAIQSVIDQTFKKWELLIVDDGSTDETQNLIDRFVRKDPRIKYFYQNHQERSSARNRGIKEATGSYLCFLDDDDYYLQNHLELFHQELQKRSYPVILLRTGFYKRKSGKDIPSTLYDQVKHSNPVNFAAYYFCSSGTFCFPKECFRANLFPENYAYWEDTHLILRLLHSFSFYQIPHYTYIYLQHSNRTSLSLYQTPDPMVQIQSNINAIQDFFDNYQVIANKWLPKKSAGYLVARKYLDHGHGALSVGKYSLALRCLQLAIKQDSSRRIWNQAIKLGIKLLIYHPIVRSKFSPA